MLKLFVAALVAVVHGQLVLADGNIEVNLPLTTSFRLSFQTQHTGGDLKCVCAAEDLCVNNPCQNGGTCGLNPTDTSLPLCRCPLGFTGDYCETDIDDCDSNRCLNGGLCSDMVNNFMCNCTDTGFNGSICENNIDDCSPNPCPNGGDCHDRVLSFDCCLVSGHIQQWVSGVVGFSTEYGGSWDADKVIGPPDVYPRYGDISGAWAQANLFDAYQYLTVSVEIPLRLYSVAIYETYHAGGVKSVLVKRGGGAWVEIWKTESVQDIRTSRILNITISPPLAFKTNQIRFNVDCTAANSYVEIDAINFKGYD